MIAADTERWFEVRPEPQRKEDLSMTANLHLESYFRDTAEYFGIEGVPEVFVETLKRVRNRRGDKDFRSGCPISEPRVMPNGSQGWQCLPDLVAES
jgi:hypothetical protein